MEDRKYKVDLYLYDRPLIINPIEFYQNDTESCAIEFNFNTDRVNKFDLTNKTVEIRVTKPDLTTITDSATITEINTAVWELKLGAISVSGSCSISIYVYQNTERLTFGTLKYKVIADREVGNVGSQSEYPILTQLIANAQAAVNESNQVNENIVAVEFQRGQNEQQRIANEDTRKSAEQLRQQNETTRNSDFNNIKSEYSSIKGIMIDTNNAANLQNQVNQVNTQLADVTPYVSDGKIKLFNTNTQIPCTTFISDDGWLGDKTLLKPLFDQKGIVGCLSIVSDYINNNTTYISVNDMIQFQNQGWEILSHTKSHKRLAGLTEQELELELKVSKEVLISNGLNVESLVQPYGSYDALSQSIAKKYYRCAFARSNTINTLPIDTYRIARVLIGQDAVAPSNTLAYYKSMVDAAIASNAWLVFCTHGNQLGSTELAILSDLIDYIKLKNMPVLTVKQALGRFENVFESRNEITGQYTVIGKDGTIYSNRLETTVQRESVNARTASDLISAFPPNQITITPISLAGASTFPDAKAGELLTNRVYSTDNGFQYQEYFIYATNRRLYRNVKADGNWATTWSEINYKPISQTVNVTSRTLNPNQVIDIVLGFPLANVGDNILCQPSGDLEAGILFSCIPYTTGNVKLRLFNCTTSAVTIAAKDWVLRKIV